jgi:hypothetical protein
MNKSCLSTSEFSRKNPLRLFILETKSDRRTRKGIFYPKSLGIIGMREYVYFSLPDSCTTQKY